MGPWKEFRTCVLLGDGAVSSDEEAMKRRYREFLDLMPLTIAIAGLPHSEGNRHYTTEQLELRAQTLVNAFKVARAAAREAMKGSSA